MRFPQGAEWLIILLVVLLLFGAKRLPDAARGLGRSLRILKAETKGLHDDDEKDSVTQAEKREQLPPSPPTTTSSDEAAPAEEPAPGSDRSQA